MDSQLCCDFMDIARMKGDSKYERGFEVLGPPFLSGSLTFLEEKAMRMMQGWKTKQISLAGEETLIKSVVQEIPTYAMACFLLPKSQCDKLNSLTPNFGRKGNPEDRGICWHPGIVSQKPNLKVEWGFETTELSTKQC